MGTPPPCFVQHDQVRLREVGEYLYGHFNLRVREGGQRTNERYYYKVKVQRGSLSTCSCSPKKGFVLERSGASAKQRVDVTMKGVNPIDLHVCVWAVPASFSEASALGDATSREHDWVFNVRLAPTMPPLPTPSPPSGTSFFQSTLGRLVCFAFALVVLRYAVMGVGGFMEVVSMLWSLAVQILFGVLSAIKSLVGALWTADATEGAVPPKQPKFAKTKHFKTPPTEPPPIPDFLFEENVTLGMGSMFADIAIDGWGETALWLAGASSQYLAIAVVVGYEVGIALTRFAVSYGLALGAGFIGLLLGAYDFYTMVPVKEEFMRLEGQRLLEYAHPQGVVLWNGTAHDFQEWAEEERERAGSGSALLEVLQTVTAKGYAAADEVEQAFSLSAQNFFFVVFEVLLVAVAVVTSVLAINSFSSGTLGLRPLSGLLSFMTFVMAFPGASEVIPAALRQAFPGAARWLSSISCMVILFCFTVYVSFPFVFYRNSKVLRVKIQMYFMGTALLIAAAVLLVLEPMGDEEEEGA